MTCLKKFQNSIFMILAMMVTIVPMNFASITRTRTLGDVGMIVQDNANFWLFPATIINNANQAICELGGQPELIYYSASNYALDRWAGAMMALGRSRQHMLAAFWSERKASNTFILVPVSSIPAEHQVNLFYGRKTSDTSLGLQLSRAGSFQQSRRNAEVSSETSIHQTQLRIGVTRAQADASFAYQYAAFTTTGSDVTAHSFNLRMRWLKSMRASLQLVPFIDVSFTTEHKGPVTTDGRFWQLWPGLGLNYQVGKGDLLILGLSTLYNNQTTKTPDADSKTGSKTFDCPFIFGGLESELFPWLKLRIGFQKTLRHFSQTTESGSSTQENSRTEAPFASTFGLGLHYKRFTIDFSWDSNFLRRGPYFLSGSKGDMVNFISMNYDF